MDLITAELRVNAALKSRLPPVTKLDSAPGQRVRVYRESSRRWEGPFTISRIAGNLVWVSDGDKVKHFSCTQILPDPADIVDREMGRLLEGFPDMNSGGITGIFVTDLLHPSVDKGDGPLFNLPKVKELCGLFDKGTFRVVCSYDIEEGAILLGGRFVLAIMNTETNRPVYKARFVVQGHLEK